MTLTLYDNVIIYCNTSFNNLPGIISNIVKENGHLDILCNNAGIGHSDDVAKVVCINLVGAINISFNLCYITMSGLS